ncbi:MAG: radical SAM protein, partial [Candidatus Korarchaeota archaeon]|nr:radical SAM protein [Candidatus Korarchaeota archaeon]
MAVRISLVGALIEKERAIDRLSSMLDPEERREAERDPHARRRPRPCGLTIHTGTGCSYGCVYCYVPDMGFPMRPRPYPLAAEQLAYAVAINPYVAVGRHGTLLALGSVTEPLLPETRDRALAYIEALRGFLGNPAQLSTKAYIDAELAGELAGRDPSISILVSLSTLRMASRLEPGAPSPRERLEGIGNASRRGLHVSLFLRPIIPGVTEADAPAIMHGARVRGARGVVMGSLR